MKEERRRVSLLHRFSAAETGEAMQQLVLAYMDARDNQNKQIVTDSMCDIGFFMYTSVFGW